MTENEILAAFEPKVMEATEFYAGDVCQRCCFKGEGCYVRPSCNACDVVASSHPELEGVFDRMYLVRKVERTFVGYVAVDSMGAFLYPKYPPVQSGRNWSPSPKAVESNHSSIVRVPADFLGDRMPAEGEAPVRVTLTVKVE